MEEEEDESDIDHAALPITDDDESTWSIFMNHDSVNLKLEVGNHLYRQTCNDACAC